MGLIKKLKKYITGKRMQWPIPYRKGVRLEEISMRDPYIVKDDKGGYLLTGTIYHLNYNDSYGTVAYKSKDKELWDGPVLLLDKYKNLNTYCDFWAPEIHKAQGKYRLLVTLKQKGQKRGTFMFSSTDIDGEYTDMVRLTPEDKSCLDATLVFDGGQWWCVYCYEYIDCIDGQIRAVKIKDDFSATIPDTDRLLFKASANKFKATKSKYKVSDGPFAYYDGGLKLLWSTHIKGDKYVQLSAKAVDNRIDGEWVQEKPLYVADGGHGMIFTDYDGVRYLLLHTPNAREIFSGRYEKPEIINFDMLLESAKAENLLDDHKK